MIDAEYVDTEPALERAVEALCDQPRYALDTEFHRERTYFPKVALVQIAWPDHLVLIDPLAVSLRPLGRLLETDATAVMHAASQDLEVLENATGRLPRRLFDTQVAAGFVGMSTPSLAALHDRFLGVRLPKAGRLTDWLARPLRPEQLEYAASDVRRLLEIHDLLLAELEERNRLDWAVDECALALDRGANRRDPEQVWRRIKEVRTLKGDALALARVVAAWRERRAAEVDQPVRFILPDIGIASVAQRPPATVAELRGRRGIEDRHLRGGSAESLLEAVREGQANPPPPPERTVRPKPSSDLRPAVALVSAWVGQLANDLEIEAAMLGTRADIEALVRGDAQARMSTGWRDELVGEPLRRLLRGESALAFEAGSGLVLEPRSASDRGA